MSSASDLPKTLAPIIFGCTGTALDADERAFFRDASPAGFILFKKNCDTPDQVRALVDGLRDCVGWRAPVMIDQEGGRVQRLRPPHWPDFPAPRIFGDLYKTDRARSITAFTAAVEGLAAVQSGLGIDVNCIPVLDVVPEGNATRAIDNRSLGSDPQLVAELGLRACRVAVESGITPVMKHIPGHGRATVDSHHDLPRVETDADTLARTDWVPFRSVASGIDNASLWGMTAHVIYAALDADLPATLSHDIIGNVIRTAIGFDGILTTDDLFMDALAPFGDVPERARRAVQAGCDLALHCHGTVPERVRAAAAVGGMAPQTRVRLGAWAEKRPVAPAAKPVDTVLAAMSRALGA